jgi:NADH:ubiquinone oxidoreductase subunit F (NADH-binding)
VYCLGQCFAAPASGRDDVRPRVETTVRDPIVLERVAGGGAGTLEAYRTAGGFVAFEQALAAPPASLVAEIEASQLRGRGGAGFPAGRKWRAVHEEPSAQKYVVCNADEGDPGAYVDRFLMEDDPYCVLEAMLIAGYAVGASQGYVYVRKEYPSALTALTVAVRSLRDAGLLGGNALGREFTFNVEVVSGEGSYLCGEETALLNALEGRRPEVRARPPYPVRHGLWQRPTLVHNVETLANVPWIVRHGGDAYAGLGQGASRGTKVLSLNSLFRRPGLYEVELGTLLTDVVHDLGGGLRTGSLAGVVVGGPLAAAIPPDRLDVRLTFEDLYGIGAALGHGGVVAFDTHTSIAQLVEHVFAFGAYESCGKCTPCRVGATEVATAFAELPAGRPGVDHDRWDRTVAALRDTSLCGHGAGLAEFAEGTARLYPEEARTWFASR